LTTLGEAADRLRYLREKELNLQGKSLPDQRGRHKKGVIASDVVNQVREHIYLYPAVEGHYFRARSQRKYLPEGLNMNEMYRQYLKHCEKHSLQPVKVHKYRDIFCTDFKYGFHMPKKDQCATCNKYNQLSGNEKEGYKETFDTHQKRKDDSRTMKAADKQLAIDSNMIAATCSRQLLTCRRYCVVQPAKSEQYFISGSWTVII